MRRCPQKRQYDPATALRLATGRRRAAAFSRVLVQHVSTPESVHRALSRGPISDRNPGLLISRVRCPRHLRENLLKVGLRFRPRLTGLRKGATQRENNECSRLNLHGGAVRSRFVKPVAPADLYGDRVLLVDMPVIAVGGPDLHAHIVGPAVTVGYGADVGFYRMRRR